jgi:small subunit ribosomal protein S20
VATHKSAAKRARQTIKRTERNLNIKSRVKTLVRAFREAAVAGDKDKAQAAYEVATRELRKAASKGIMKKTTVSRRVSRLSLAANSLA